MRRRKRLIMAFFLGAAVYNIMYLSLNVFGPKQGHISKLNLLYKFNKSILVLSSTTEKGNDISPIKKPKVHHIAFLKVHKAASSTVQNIFLRFGYKRRLNFVLPAIPSLAWPNVISTTTSLTSYNIMQCPQNETFDILCCHVIYNREAFKRHMPKDTVYIGIVRDPFEHFQSSIYYFLPKYIFNIQSMYPVSEYLRYPHFYEYQNMSPKYVFTNNRMSFEFGFPEELFVSRDMQRIDEYLQELSKTFSLVIVVEYLDESLLLMKHILNWSLQDILYIRKNTAGKKLLRQPDDLRHLQEWATLDYALYDFFHARLWKQIARLGGSFQKELLYYKRLRLRITDFCTLVNGSKSLVVYKSKWNKRFIIDFSECRLMMYDELTFLEKIRRRQYNMTNKFKYSYKKDVQLFYDKMEPYISEGLNI